MKITKTILAIALPLALSAGCALDVGSSAEGLTTETNADFGVNVCGQSTAKWMGDAQWPIQTIVAGDMEFTKEELVEYVETNPDDRAALIAEMAALQLNMAVGLEVPNSVLEELIAADGLVMAPEDDYGTPPPVAIDDFESIRDFNSIVGRDCFVDVNAQAEITPGRIDVRDDIVAPIPDIYDLRPDIAAVD